MAEVWLGDTLVGDGHLCYVVAEIGINHNGSIDLAKELIAVAKAAGCDAVKFQKRTLEIVYTPEEMLRPRESPFGTTNGHLKHGLEFGLREYREIDRYCQELKIPWTASCWDEPSVDFIAKFNVPFFKVASASLTDDNLLLHTRAAKRPVVLSTGMSTLGQVDHAVEVLRSKDLVLMHTMSAYPAYYDELNLRTIPMLKDRYAVPVGYSGHETGLPSSAAAVALGACMVERHITTDRSLWGSDHAASLEPNGLAKLVRDIRIVERALGDGVKKVRPR